MCDAPSGEITMNEEFEIESTTRNTSTIFKSIFGSMRERLNTYWAKTAKETLENEFERDMLFDADMSRRLYELRKRIRIKHLI